jgi:adenylyltransferase/sulfurtransferase
VLVVGVGGLGCPALLYLAAAGIGKIGFIDPDRVDVSNLQRQIIFTHADLGKPKVAAAKDHLSLVNPEIDLHAYEQELNIQNIIGLISGYDIILDGTDNFSAKFLINDAAVITGKPVVYGALQGFEGQLAVFDASRGACYRCLFPAPPEATILNCATAGILGPVAGFIGTLQAMEVLRLVVQSKKLPPFMGKLMLADLRNMTTRILNIPKRKDCPVCSKPSSEIVLQPSSPVCSANMTEQVDCADIKSFGNAVFLDVRELYEWEQGHIQGALHIPLSVLQKNPSVFEQAPPGRPCIVYCQRGQRSLRAAELLASIGISNIFSLSGGYEAWKTHTRTNE